MLSLCFSLLFITSCFAGKEAFLDENNPPASKKPEITCDWLLKTKKITFTNMYAGEIELLIEKGNHPQSKASKKMRKLSISFSDPQSFSQLLMLFMTNNGCVANLSSSSPLQENDRQVLPTLFKAVKESLSICREESKQRYNSLFAMLFASHTAQPVRHIQGNINFIAPEIYHPNNLRDHVNQITDHNLNFFHLNDRTEGEVLNRGTTVIKIYRAAYQIGLYMDQLENKQEPLTYKDIKNLLVFYSQMPDIISTLFTKNKGIKNLQPLKTGGTLLHKCYKKLKQPTQEFSKWYPVLIQSELTPFSLN